MPDPGSVAAVVAVSAALTWGLRAAPFAVLAPMRESAVVAHLSRRMPLGVMVVLAAYTLRDVPTDSAVAALPFVVAVAVTVGLHLWRRNALVSILVGTVVHVALATALAGG
ncbi:Branched-chain amino acid transport protein AzlD [Geodermatophilus siccatus]|uniref:Branched-chain amino acid transport protein AzlD n=1 Tax=Geodermatophilus siccatus TaxID=1137991 RepID=A0A1G9TJY5_9ACTN|nr:AzlD domain-containing protein [Geodermatophilus siccatus]SDM47963.1 Branched-chain amino acid transport protein AzlD [Geodermatophilus siccatus]